MAYEARYSLESLLAFPGVAALRQVTVIGGSTRNSLLMRLKATILNQPIRVAAVSEAVCLGAAILGGLGAGVYADVPSALAHLRHNPTTIEPVAAEAALYETYYQQVYRQLYLTLKPLHHTIYQLT